MRTPTRLWLRWHARHGTGPMLRRREARALDTSGNATGPVAVVTWYRCECKAVRAVSRESEHDGQ